MSQTEAPAETTTPIPPDPLIHKSYSVPIALASLVVLAATVVTVVDEMWLRRPYKSIQGKYQETDSEADAALDADGKTTEAELKTPTDEGRKPAEALKEHKSNIAALSYEAEDKAHAYGHAKVEDSPEARPLIDEVAQVQGREIT